MSQKINITFKTRPTLANIFKKEMDELGFDTSGLKNEKDTLHAYCSYVSRLVETRPRKIHKADTFVCPEDVKNGLAWLESKIEKGESVNAHLNGATKKNKLDGLLFDWGIQHLHLGEKLVAPGYVERTGNVLFAIFKPDDVYFIDIRDHEGWSDKALLDSVNRNWPELLSCYKIDGKSEYNPTSSDITQLRKKGVNAMIELSDGNSYVSMGGGITTAGTSMNATRTYIELIRMLNGVESQINKNARYFSKSLRPKGRAMLNRFRFVFVCRRDGDMIRFYDVVNNNYWEQYLTIPTLKVRFGV